jgi:ribosome-associated protein
MSESAGETNDSIAPGVSFVPGALRFQFSRGGGPGGQNVNKVNTKAELWLELRGVIGMRPSALARLAALAGSNFTLAGEVHLVSTIHRTQERNRQEALEKLREMILKAMVEPKRRRKTRPTQASRRRRLEGKRHRGEIKTNRRSAGE